MKVLQVVPSLGVGGAERLVSHLCTYIKQHTSHEIRVISLYGRCGSDIEVHLEHAHVKVMYLGKHDGFDFRIFGRLSAVIHEYSPDVVHTHQYILRYLLFEILRSRHIYWLHTVHNVACKETDRVGLALNRWLYRKRVQPVAIAKELGRHLADYYRLHDVVSITNGIPVENYIQNSSVRTAWRKTNGFDDNDVLLTCAARFNEQKNHISLLDSFVLVSRRVPGAHLLLVGDGILKGAIVKRIEQLGLRSRVHLLGIRHDISEILAASDIFVLASSWEGSPLCIMEAMAAALPCVATQVGGVPELVEDGMTGFLSPSGNSQDFSNNILKLVYDFPVRTSMGQRAREYAKEHFDISAMADRYLSLYEAGIFGRGKQMSNLLTRR